ncbi:hypothetical protein [Caldicellulosiruptor acetigenus]|uniref:hypothetical protein n=1 Tax=Caldicellulosiruptor acetigenus TaxID=301953 RepID=UPI0003FFD9A2|nr:hypothetical protein [Caldicellulosiruptor acetigenus]WAM36997.1 hypothetical protein OTK01_000812 [Caldicellulosiruptor acetigenus]
MMETSAKKELHRIRERIYEETENISRDEFIEYIRRKANKVREETKRFREKTVNEIN